MKEQQLFSDTLQLIGQGRFEEAHRASDELWLLMTPDEGYAELLITQTMDEIAVAFAKMNRTQDGADILKRKLAAVERWYGTESPEMVTGLVGTACSAGTGLGMSELAFNLLDRASALAIGLDGEESTQMEEIYRARYSLLVRNHDKTAAYAQADKLLDLSARIHGAGNESVLKEAQEAALLIHREADAAAHETPFQLHRLGCT